MKLTVLADNYTIIDRYYLGEPALSFLLEDGEERILFDTGYSDVFLKNADRLGVDLSAVTQVAISHGHIDHTGGLPLLRDRGLLAGRRLTACPGAFHPKREGEENTGALISQAELEGCCALCLTERPAALSEHVTFLGKIPRRFAFEPPRAMGVVEDAAGARPDYVEEDTALACKTDQGLFLVTGCSHSGVCSIIAHAQAVCGEARIAGVIGGFHLFGRDEQLSGTIAYFQALGIPRVIPCHCVSLEAKCEMRRAFPIEEIGSGSVIEF